ncbi:MAG: hypothetical protein R2861_03410 [Desulfobacterales bacterium]
MHVSLILLGITENASEIQIDPEQDVARVNFIISGQFHERLQIEKNVFRQLVKNIQKHGKDSRGGRPIAPIQPHSLSNAREKV